MAGRGRAPKPAAIRQRTNKKPGAGILQLSTAPRRGRGRSIPNPDGLQWHALTLAAWKRAWASPMASRWLAEIRQQESRFGLSPLDRSRLSWEIARGEEAERKKPQPQLKATGTSDARGFLTSLK